MNNYLISLKLSYVKIFCLWSRSLYLKLTAEYKFICYRNNKTLFILLKFVFKEFTTVIIKFCNVHLVIKKMSDSRDQTSVECLSIYLVVFVSTWFITPNVQLTCHTIIYCYYLLISSNNAKIRHHICLKQLYAVFFLS